MLQSGVLFRRRARRTSASTRARTCWSGPARSRRRGSLGFIFESLEERTVLSASLQLANTDNQTTAVPGVVNTYTIVASNGGPDAATGVTVSDNFPDGFTNATFTALESGGATGASDGSGFINQVVDLPAGASITYTITGVILPSATGVFTHLAQLIPSVGGQPILAADPDVLTPQSDLRVTMTADFSSPDVYTITETNAGPSDAPGATLTDEFPANFASPSWVGNGQWGQGNLSQTLDLGAGVSVTYTVEGVVNNPAVGNLVNTATISAGSGTTDPDLSNNTATNLRPMFHAFGLPFSNSEFSTLTENEVARFTYGDDSASIGSFTATIDWGDGTTSAGIIYPAIGAYGVSAFHPYSDEGHYVTTVHINAPAASTDVKGQATIHEQILLDATLDEQFVQEAFHDVLHRAVDASGLAFWSNQLAIGLSRQALAHYLLTSPEYTAAEVQTAFERFLHRGADPAAVAAFAPLLAGGLSPQHLDEIIVSSPEYLLSQGGGTNDGFLDALFADVLHRSSLDVDARNFFDNLLAQGGTRAQAADVVFTSTAYAFDAIQSLYDQYFDRPVDAPGLAADTAQLRSGFSELDLAAAIIGSDGYLLKVAT